MRIIETEINDSQYDSVKEEKIKLAEHVIQFTKSMLTKDYKNFVLKITQLKENISKKQNQIKLEKEDLVKLLKFHSKQENEQQLLKKIGKLIQDGLVQESTKPEIIKMLTTVENDSEEKILLHLTEVNNILGK